MRRSFLLACAAIAVAALIAMLPQREPKSTPTNTAGSGSLNIPNSTLSIPTVLPTDPVHGFPTAPLTIIEFGDFTCPSCVEAEAMLTELRQQYGPQLRIVWKDFPILDRITGSRRTHIAARCAQRQQRFWEYRDAALAEQPRDDGTRIAIATRLGIDAAAFTACLTQEQPAALVDTGLREAATLRLQNAPTLFVNGERLEGHPTTSDLRALLDRALR